MQIIITTNIVFKNTYASRISGFHFFSLFDEQAGFHPFAIFEYLKLILNTALKYYFPFSSNSSLSLTSLTLQFSHFLWLFFIFWHSLLLTSARVCGRQEVQGYLINGLFNEKGDK